MEYPLLNHIIIILALVLFISVIFRYLRLPQILGYLAVGAVAGPHGVGWIKNVEDAHAFAAFGVVFLMFTVGLEFSLSRMRALRRSAVLLGGSQVFICSLLGLAIGVWGLRLPWYAALVAGGILAMSSTAITVKQLTTQLELSSTHGQNAVAILLFQDLAVIPFFILIGSIGVLNHQPSVILALTGALLKGVVAIVIIIGLGRWLLRPLFHTIANTHLIELFTLAVLLVTLAAAWLSQNFGLSFALGAFLAGMILSETKFRHQIEIEIRPFRDVLLGLFFITIGMLLNVSSWRQDWLWILLLFFSFSLIKILVIFGFSLLFKINKFVSLRTALILAQGGEFSFALLTLGLTNKIFPPGYGQTILGALLLSFAIAPLLITYNRQIAQFVFPKLPQFSHADAIKQLSETIGIAKNHVIICGYGRVGQNITLLLEREKIPYIALDLDAKHIHETALAGKPVSYGDATHPALLEAAGIKTALALVISFDNPPAAVKILQYINSNNLKLPTMVRCKDEAELVQFAGQRASQIVVETHEESLTLIYHLLRTLQIPQVKVNQLIEDIRKKHYEKLNQYFPGTFTEEMTETGIPLKQLKPIILLKGTEAAGKSIAELTATLENIEVVAVRRDKNYYANPSTTFQLAADDVVILYGTAEDLEKAEEIL